MTDPYADVDPSRGRWIWWAVGLYGVSFLVPGGPLVASSSWCIGARTASPQIAPDGRDRLSGQV